MALSRGHNGKALTAPHLSNYIGPILKGGEINSLQSIEFKYKCINNQLQATFQDYFIIVS